MVELPRAAGRGDPRRPGPARASCCTTACRTDRATVIAARARGPVRPDTLATCRLTSVAARSWTSTLILADPGIRIVVCCGAGGVGKTTTAAALALRAAEKHGRRTVVLTIDPARRLAQSLGLTELDNTPRQVKGIDAEAGGELHAMMLDMKRTFDEVVLTHTDPKRAEEIFANPFYQAMSSTFAGTQEYMAMEKLGQLRARDEWDLIVVDTPPSRSALDFLDAPARLGRFLDGRMLRLLLAPARAGGRSVFSLVSASFGVFGRAVHEDARRAAADRPVRLRRRARLDVRRVPRARRADLPRPAGPRDGVPAGRGAGAGRDPGGGLLRRPAGERAHAAGRPGAQPGAPTVAAPAAGRRAQPAAAGG